MGCRPCLCGRHVLLLAGRAAYNVSVGADFFAACRTCTRSINLRHLPAQCSQALTKIEGLFQTGSSCFVPIGMLHIPLTTWKTLYIKLYAAPFAPRMTSCTLSVPLACARSIAARPSCDVCGVWWALACVRACVCAGALGSSGDRGMRMHTEAQAQAWARANPTQRMPGSHSSRRGRYARQNPSMRSSPSPGVHPPPKETLHPPWPPAALAWRAAAARPARAGTAHTCTQVRLGSEG